MFACNQKKEQPAVQKEAAVPTQVTGIEAILSPDAKMEKVTAGIEFDTAATPLYADGELYFTNTTFEQPERCRTMKLDRNGQIHILMGNNGLVSAIQHSGRGTFYCCEMLGHRVVETDRNGIVIHVVAGEFDERRIDGPNDLTVDSKGGIYFTDSQFIGKEQKVQDTPAVYYINPGGFVVRIIDDLEFPNGIELSPDEKILYVVNTRGEKTKGRFVRAYDVLEDGTVTNGRDFAEIQFAPEESAKPDGAGGADGTAVDSAGNLYVATTKGIGVQVFDSSGKHLGNIPCPSVTNNISFGGEDMKTLYISAKDGIYKIPVKIPGVMVPKAAGQ
jgi:gluconolactonase